MLGEIVWAHGGKSEWWCREQAHVEEPLTYGKAHTWKGIGHGHLAIGLNV